MGMVQAPRIYRPGLVKGRTQANVAAQQALIIAHWKSIVMILNKFLKIMKDKYVSSLTDSYHRFRCQRFFM